jgi:hypothetical protein
MRAEREKIENDYFGDPARLREYHILFSIGLIMLIVGIPFLFLQGNWIIPGVVLMFIGFICFLSGWLGKKEETKKSGVKRVSTSVGKTAFFFGIMSVFVSNGPYLSLILGSIAIICSVKAKREGDNEYGITGGIAGIIGIIVNLYVTVLFALFL